MRTGRLEELADQVPHGRVVALAEVHGADVALGVDQVVGRPVLVAVGVPRRVVVVDGDRVPHPECRGLGPHVGDDVLEGELGGVHAANAAVRMTAVSPTRWVAPTTVIAASTGPAQGTYRTPTARPSAKSPAWPLGWRVPTRANGRSSSAPSGG